MLFDSVSVLVDFISQEIPAHLQTDPEIQDRIIPVGNAAGEGAKLALLNKEELKRAERLARHTEFLELAALPEFQDQFVDELEFPEI